MGRGVEYIRSNDDVVTVLLEPLRANVLLHIESFEDRLAAKVAKSLGRVAEESRRDVRKGVRVKSVADGSQDAVSLSG